MPVVITKVGEDVLSSNELGVVVGDFILSIVVLGFCDEIVLGFFGGSHVVIIGLLDVWFSSIALSVVMLWGPRLSSIMSMVKYGAYDGALSLLFLDWSEDYSYQLVVVYSWAWACWRITAAACEGKSFEIILYHSSCQTNYWYIVGLRGVNEESLCEIELLQHTMESIS